MIFLAALFILLWRFNPGVGSPLFFYLKDDLLLSEEILGFVDTAAQVASILAVILAVKIFDKIKLKKLLALTVTAAGLFGFSSFAITRPELAEQIGSFFLIDWLATLVALPVYFFEMLFSVVLGGDFTAFWQTAVGLQPLEKFLYLQSFIGELLFMLAYIPLLKLAVLICPKQAEATNFAVIASIMNIGLALSSWASGWLYARLLPAGIEATAVHLPTIEILIWVNIVTSFTCLLVLPWLREKEIVRQSA